MKTVLSILILCFCGFIQAQSNSNTAHKQLGAACLEYNSTSEKLTNSAKASFQIDTLKPASFSQSCFVNPQTSLVIYASDYVSPHDSGFVSGNNVYGDIEKAQHYINTSSLTIKGCAILLNRATSSHTNSVGAKLKLYSFSSLPSILLATSAIKPMDSLNNNGYTIFNFTSPVIVTSDFLVSIVLPQNTGDTMAIYSTKVNCNSGASLSWERAVDSTFGTIHTNWNFSNTDNIDLAIFPLIETTTTGISNLKNAANYFYFNNVNNLLRFSPSISKSNLIIYDMIGRRILSKETEGEEVIDLSFLISGCYIIKSENENQVIFKKIIIKR